MSGAADRRFKWQEILVRICQLWIGALIMAACTSNGPSPLAVSHGCQNWLPQNINQVEDLATLAPIPAPAPVVALDFDMANRELTAAYASVDDQPGAVLTWNIAVREIAHRLQLDWIHPTLTRISKSGQLLATLDTRAEAVEEKRKVFPLSEGIAAIIDLRLLIGNRQRDRCCAYLGHSLSATCLSIASMLG